MQSELTNLSKEVKINNELGLHARPAAQIAKLAQKAVSRIWLVKDEESVDASSIIDILSIACTNGSRVRIKIEDQADMDILLSIVDLMENGLDD